MNMCGLMLRFISSIFDFFFFFRSCTSFPKVEFNGNMSFNIKQLILFDIFETSINIVDETTFHFISIHFITSNGFFLHKPVTVFSTFNRILIIATGFPRFNEKRREGSYRSRSEEIYTERKEREITCERGAVSLRLFFSFIFRFGIPAGIDARRLHDRQPWDVYRWFKTEGACGARCTPLRVARFKPGRQPSYRCSVLCVCSTSPERLFARRPRASETTNKPSRKMWPHWWSFIPLRSPDIQI